MKSYFPKPERIAMPKSFSWFTSKTVWGAIVASVGVLTDPQVFALLPQKVASVVTVAGVVLGVVGARGAIAKNGAGR